MRRTTKTNGNRAVQPRAARRQPAERSARPISGRLNPRLRFLGEFIREPLTVGSLWPSSAALARLLVESSDFSPGDTVVELGPGTGAFTGLILDRLRERGRLLAVEINRSNAAVLRRRFPHCEVIHDSADSSSRSR